MSSTDNTFQRKLLSKRLEEERKNGYPSFKNSIAQQLVDSYGIKSDEALSYAFSPELDKEILKDITWSQHMGVDYWAEVIYEDIFCSK